MKLTTERIFRSFRSDAQNPGSGPQPGTESTQNETIRAEVPADGAKIPVTLGSFRYLWDWPTSLSESRPSWTDMSNYSHYAPWLGGGNPWVRGAGIWYHRLIARPVSAICRSVEALAERPLRLIVAGIFTWWGWSLITDWLAR